MSNTAIQLTWSLLCQRAIIDSQTQLLSIHDVLENLEVEVKPNKSSDADKRQNFVLPLEYYLITYWRYDAKVLKDKTIRFKVELLDPKDSVLNSVEQEFQADDPMQKTRHILRIKGLPLNESGTYKMRISLIKPAVSKTLGEVFFDVKVNVKNN